MLPCRAFGQPSRNTASLIHRRIFASVFGFLGWQDRKVFLACQTGSPARSPGRGAASSRLPRFLDMVLGREFLSFAKASLEVSAAESF